MGSMCEFQSKDGTMITVSWISLTDRPRPRKLQLGFSSLPSDPLPLAWTGFGDKNSSRLSSVSRLIAFCHRLGCMRSCLPFLSINKVADAESFA